MVCVHEYHEFLRIQCAIGFMTCEILKVKFVCRACCEMPLFAALLYPIVTC